MKHMAAPGVRCRLLFKAAHAAWNMGTAVWYECIAKHVSGGCSCAAHLDLGHAHGRGRQADQVELAQQAVAAGHVALADVQQDGKLALPRVHRREDLQQRHRRVQTYILSSRQGSLVGVIVTRIVSNRCA